eukprot:346231_1
MISTFIIFKTNELIIDIAVMFTIFGYGTCECIIIYITTIWIIKKNKYYLNLFGGKNDTNSSPHSLQLKPMHSAALSLNKHRVSNNDNNGARDSHLSVVNTLHLATLSDDKSDEISNDDIIINYNDNES